MEIFNVSFLKKLSGLLFSLKHSNKEFEMVADEVGNHSLRTALNGLSDESDNYAGELKDYLDSLGIFPPRIPDEADEAADYEYVTATGEAGDELLHICTRNENKLVQAYNDLLSECMPCQSLKDIMAYQLNALRFTFLKIKTLNTARFAAY